MARLGSYAKGKERREEIIQSAFSTLAKLGYEQASLRQIAQRIGLESPHILYYFESREELLIEVLRIWDAQTDLEAESSEFIDLWLANIAKNQTNPGIVQLYTAFAAEATSPDHPAHSYFVERFKSVQTMLGQYFANRQATGEINPALDPFEVADNIIALSDGLQLRWLIDRSIDMAAQMRLSIRLLETSSGAAPGR